MSIQSINHKCRPRVRQKIGFMQEQDRLSSLPEELLLCVLSFIPTKEAIRTSILSLRWKYLWTCIPHLEFEFDSNMPRRDCLAKHKNFTDTVDKLFRHREDRLCIDKFRIWSTHNTWHRSNVDAWTSFLCSRHVKEFDLQLSNISTCQLSSSLLTCKTLVILRLSGQFELDVPATLSLPRLKSLYLDSVKCSNGASVEKILFACPILEALVMIRNECDGARIMKISVPSLKRLKLDFEPWDSEQFNIEKSVFSTVINTPNLEYLKLYDYCSKYILLNYMPSLVEARVDVLSLERSPIEVGGGGGGVVSAISDVKFLSLYRCAMDSIRHNFGHQHLPIFHNVSTLKLGFDVSRSWEFVLNMIRRLPKLQVLVFRQGLFEVAPIKSDLGAPGEVPVCLSLCLKTIEINNYYGELSELILLDYLLEYAKVLENLMVHCYLTFGVECLVDHKALSMLPRGSSCCRLKFFH